MAMAINTAEITWFTHLLTYLNVQQTTTPLVLCDNLSALQLTINPVFHASTKHIEIDYHSVREQVAHRCLETRHIHTSEQLVDAFAKALLAQPFLVF